MIKVIIQRTPFDDRVERATSHQLNTCNLWLRENTNPPDDYIRRQELTCTREWIEEFHDFIQVIKLKNIRWMKEAALIGKITGLFPKSYCEELAEYPMKFDGGYFIRTEHTSLKTGVGGVKPYTTLKSVIESIVTCNKTHQALQPTDDVVRIYLMPWKELITDSECRVFVHNNKITAVSCQHWPSLNPYLDDMTDDELGIFILKLLQFFNDDVRDKLTYLSDYTFDVCLDTTEEFYFIEPNGFGANYAAGSSLFEWTTDDAILNGDGSQVVLRL